LVEWVGSSLKEVRSFPKNTKREIGYALDNIQHGANPPDWKPIPGIGKGVYELRIHSEGEFRVIYLAKFIGKIYVLHAFKKKTQKTPKKDLDISKLRLQEVLVSIGGKHGK
jgi:phage-related protein